jgi:hypothetical protein
MSVDSHGGMILRGGTEVFEENSASVPLCPSQIPHGLTRARPQASALRGRRQTARAIALP